MTKYYKYKLTEAILETYYDNTFHECRRGAWSLRDVITKKQFYFNGFSITVWNNHSEEELIKEIDAANERDFTTPTEEDVSRLKLMRLV